MAGETAPTAGDRSVLRAALRREIEETRVEFHRLLASIPDEAFALPSDNPAWTIGEVLYHMSLAPRMLGEDVKLITGHSWLMRLVPLVVPKAAFDWFNKQWTRYGARNLSRQFLAEAYDKAHESTLRALDAVTDADFDRRVDYPDWDPMLAGEMTLERLFHYVKAHFDAHAAQIRAQQGQWTAGTH